MAINTPALALAEANRRRDQPKEKRMRLMVVYHDPNQETHGIIELHSDTLEISSDALNAAADLDQPREIVAIIEVLPGVDYDKLLYGQSVSMHPHKHALMITKASTNELNDAAT